MSYGKVGSCQGGGGKRRSMRRSRRKTTRRTLRRRSMRRSRRTRSTRRRSMRRSMRRKRSSRRRTVRRTSRRRSRRSSKRRSMRRSRRRRSRRMMKGGTAGQFAAGVGTVLGLGALGVLSFRAYKNSQVQGGIDAEMVKKLVGEDGGGPPQDTDSTFYKALVNLHGVITNSIEKLSGVIESGEAKSLKDARKTIHKAIKEEKLDEMEAINTQINILDIAVKALKDNIGEKPTKRAFALAILQFVEKQKKPEPEPVKGKEEQQKVEVKYTHNEALKLIQDLFNNTRLVPKQSFMGYMLRKLENEGYFREESDKETRSTEDKTVSNPLNDDDFEDVPLDDTGNPSKGSSGKGTADGTAAAQDDDDGGTAI